MESGTQWYIAVLAVIAGLSPIGTAQERRPTAREIVESIQQHVGIPWTASTVDTFEAGNPDARVRGIAVTMMATLDVLQRAAEKGENLVVTHEPTFYNHLDKPEGMNASDPVWAAKRAFIETHGIVVWSFTITGI